VFQTARCLYADRNKDRPSKKSLKFCTTFGRQRVGQGNLSLRKKLSETLSSWAAPAFLGILAMVSCKTSPPPPPKKKAPIKPLMVKEFSPSMSRIAFNLFHRKDSTSKEEAFKDIVKRTETILNAAELLKDLQALKAEDTPQFQAKARSLARQIKALKNAAYNQNQEQTIHWYWHVQESCNNCHSQFRGY
jgi:cytochrome c556